MTDLLHPLSIGGVRLPNNLVLSPMAGYSDLPFRVLCRRHGAGLVCTEMVAASSVERDVRPHLVRMQTTAEERPTSIQLFGTNPDEVGRAAKEAERHCDILGFNMGCPAPQIKRQGCGAALLDRPDLAVSLVATIRASSRKPLLVKLRAGNRDFVDVVALARRLESAGADGFIFHARTAWQGYSGLADWDRIRELKQRVGVPVVGNGDVTDGPSARARLVQSGADGIALGRATLGDPRVFNRIARFLGSGEVLPAPAIAERVGDFFAYLEMAESVGLDRSHILQQAQRFTKGIRGGAEIRSRFQGASTPLDRIRAEFQALVPA